MDEQVQQLIQKETERQENTLDLIASENICSSDVRAALSSPFVNKYAEGYPGKRYYAGNQVIDELELLCQKRAQELFHTDYHVNVQPYSGSPANLAIYAALLEPGDSILSMDLAQGGHLTHGSPVNWSGKFYDFHFYGVNKETEEIDYVEVDKLAQEIKPKMIVCGTTAYPQQVDFGQFAGIAKRVGALLLADISHVAGLIVGGVHRSPFPHADVVMTTTHKTLRGPRGAIIFCKHDYASQIDRAVFPGMQGGPHEHTIAAKAVAFGEANTKEFRHYARQISINARTLADAFIESPLRVVSGGTDTHLVLIDITQTGIGGKLAQDRLEEVGIICNRNLIPYDQKPPQDPSGLRLGTASLTTRGMGEDEMKILANLIIQTLSDKADLNKIKSQVLDLTHRFPIEVKKR